MSEIHTTLDNLFLAPMVQETLRTFPQEYIYTSKGVIQRRHRPLCFHCGTPMSRNGYNTYRKKNIGAIKVGKWICPFCGSVLEEDRSFWDDLKNKLMGLISHMTLVLRSRHVSYEGLQEILSLIYPVGKETSRKLFLKKIESMELPKLEQFRILHYDEQYPKQGRIQKYRLTLVESESGKVIADDLFDNKSPEIIKEFLGRYLDPTEFVIMITDFDRRYPGVFEDFFEGRYCHQLCLLHLNKLIVKDFKGHGKDLDMLYLQYELLNIFYDRSRELRFLKHLINNGTRKGRTGNEWLKKARKRFFEYVHFLENRRRRGKENLRTHNYEGSSRRFLKLLNRMDSLPEFVTRRIRMIHRHWDNLTVFQFIDGVPATNNAVENYYSASLKADRKRKFRTERGIVNQLKLSGIRASGGLKYTGPPLLQILRWLIPFSAPG